ncbi:hypothetical protein CC78DRAFT_618406 [Lojkania enalia]|uniref:Protein kinase domain-containing protein n=1 Tax=Lojkania enalia TaxID=147567 RepID=A0A9P4K7E7_9PLEO|nr:hypothetical protein CC78DRAFT_618406 [Didymosphaeria enalia]
MSLFLASSIASLEGFVGYVSACAAAYRYCRGIISSMSNVGKDARYLEDQFYIENARFSAWQMLHGLTEENQFSIQEVQEAVKRILGNIQTTCEEIKKLGKKLSLEMNIKETQQNVLRQSDNQTGTRGPSRTDSSLMSPAIVSENKRKDKRQQSIKKDASLSRKFLWAIHDLKQLQQYIITLSSCNDQLDKFAHPQALQVAQEALIRLVPLPSHMEALESRIASMEGYKSVASALPIMRAEIDARITAWRVEAAESGSINHEIPSKNFPEFENLARSPLGERTIVNLEIQNVKRTMLLEWKVFNTAKVSTSDAINRINSVVSILKAAPNGSSVFRAAGYIKDDKDHEGLRSRLALLYEMPSSKCTEIGRKLRIRTLRELLTLPESSVVNQQWRRRQFRKPPLGDRFRLAARIAQAVGSIHNCGWLHKGIRPENIVFINYQDTEIDDPYILGWAHSRRNATEEQTEAMISMLQDTSLYHHPDYLRGARYCETFDQYQLGCLLMEIAHWRLLADIKSAVGPKLKGDDWSDRLIQHAEELKQDIGDIYSSVIVGLLRGIDVDDAGEGFWFNVVWELHKCRA